MTIEQLTQDLSEFVEIKEGKEGEFAEYLQGKLMSPEGVRKFAERAITLAPTDPDRQAIQPILDKYFNKGLETWKSNHLDSIIEDEVVKRNPGETEQDKRIRKLEEQVKSAEAAAKRERLQSHANRIASENGLPTDIVSHFVADDEETTESNLERLKSTLEDYTAQVVKARFREGGREVQTGRNYSASDIDKLQAQLDEGTKTGKMNLQQRVALKREIAALKQQL